MESVKVITVSPKGSDSDCARHRKPWHHLSDTEQLLFVDGYQTLKKIGVLDTFIKAHRKLNQHTLLFFWHSYFLWEFESAFRGLGGEYECFAMPYWDITNDGELWLRNQGGLGELGREPQVDDLPIYNSHLGGDGDIDNDMCVGGLWSTDYYVTDRLCADDEEAGNCCLKRLHVDSNHSRLFSRADLGEIVVSAKYANYSDFCEMKYMHTYTHKFIASVPDTHFYAANDSAADPLFPLFHSFLDYVRLLHTDCWDFDKVALDDLDQYIPYSFETLKDVDLDYEMNFKGLCEEMDGEVKTFCTEHTVTPRLMYDLSINGQWDVIYELGDFWNQNPGLMAQCADNLNDSWWADTMTEQRGGAVFALSPDNLAMHLSSWLRCTSSRVVTAGVLVAMLTLWSLYAVVRKLIAERAQSAYQCVV